MSLSVHCFNLACTVVVVHATLQKVECYQKATEFQETAIRPDTIIVCACDM